MFVELLIAGGEEGFGEAGAGSFLFQLLLHIQKIDQIVQLLDPADDFPVREMLRLERLADRTEIVRGKVKGTRLVPIASGELVAKIEQEPAHGGAEPALQGRERGIVEQRQ